MHDPVRRPLLCLVAALLLASGAPILRAAAPLTPAYQDADDPDRLFSRRDAPSVAKATAIWKSQLAAHPTDAEAAWKLSRALYWSAANATEARDTRRTLLQDGVAVARRAVAIAPSRPEGHFWMAANMGLLAETFGRREGLRYHDDIKKALDAVIAADPAFLQGSAQRALGRWYATVPGMFGGNKTLGEQHLRRALDYKRDSAITMVLLAELLIETGRRDDARPLLEAASTAPDDPEWAPEDRRFRERARARLASGLR